MGQNLFVFFSSEIWGHYFLQVFISEYEGIYILQVLPSNCILPSDLKDKKEFKNQGQYPGNFETKFFPFNALGMPSFNNSVFNAL